MAEKKLSPMETLAKLRKENAGQIGILSEFDLTVGGYSTGNIALDAVTQSVGFPEGRITECYGEKSSGKAQRWTDVVHTPDRGFVKIADLKVGDAVSSPQGGTSVLEGIFPQGVKPVFQINFTDGTSAVSCDEHLWNVDVPVHCMGYVNTTVPLARLREKVASSDYRTRDIRLPAYQPVEQSVVTLPLDPYVVGALIGDGGLTQDSVRFTSMDPYVVDRVAAGVPAGFEMRVAQTGKSKATCYRITAGQTGGRKSPFIEILRDIGLMGHSSLTKFIPDMYLSGSIEQRVALLQGLMDTDGYNGGSDKVGCCVYYTSSEKLAHDFAYLVRSLGSPAYIRDKSPTMSENRAYRVEFAPADGIEPFGLVRKQKPSYSLVRKRLRNVVSIEPLGDEECVCIKVSHPTHLYFTNDFIPTHNTTSALMAMGQELQRIEKTGEDSYVMFLDYERTLDTKYMAALGVPIDSKHCIYVKPKNLEHGANLFREMLETGSIKIAVFDSVAAMVSKKEQEAETGAVTVADRAKALHQFCRQIVSPVEEFGTSVIFLNHLLEKVATDRFSAQAAARGIKQYTRPGGKALDFYASLALEFKRIGEVKGSEFDLVTNDKDEKAVLGQKVQVKVAKFKAGEAFGTVELRIRQGRGFSQEFSVLSILTAYGIVTKADKGGSYTWPEALLPEVLKSKAKNGVFKVIGEHKMLKALEGSKEWMVIALTAARETLKDVQNERAGIVTADNPEAIEVVDEDVDVEIPELEGANTTTVLTKKPAKSPVEFVDESEVG